jgi:hypothetical protein
MPPKLDFVIAGTQKGGTSTLDAIFRSHPQIQMASTKETHFFDDENQDWDQPDYGKLDAWFPAVDDRLRGDATPITLYWRPAIRRLRKHNRDIKLIILLRDPIERTFSNWRKEYSRGADSVVFRDAIRSGRNRVTLEAETEGLHRIFAYVERSQYAKQLAYLLEYFPREQVHCELSENLFVDQAMALSRLSAFLGIDPFPADLPFVHENPGRQFEYPSTLSSEDVAYLSELFRDDVAAVEAFLGRPVSEWKTSARRVPITDDRDQRDQGSGS